ncbi:S1C family serine protease [Haloferula sp. A504]|uniref:S1C family serine protease n=1 Tax=Haloferula sp. A504 TaxID=3373601 RepID=UPI0031C6DBE0|nr:S1C family serine protease [Verrucomicrobiaceae bacterium E54]
MKKWFPTCLAALLSLLPLHAERPAINDKRAPVGREDLEKIQGLLRSALPAARAATVCIELGQGSGSGVVISKEGLILTAAHVTGGVGKKFTVRFEDGRKVEAESLGLNSENDAAIAKIIDEGTYPFVPIDREDRTRLADWVFALGHSGGFDKDRGSVVRLGRLVRISDSTYQSDCNLIGGDSGGPLFDLTGTLIGIHSRVGQRLPENMHVPISAFLESWDDMMGKEFIGEGPFAKKPRKGKGFLGLLAEEHEGDGVLVKKVGRESPAEVAGIRKGDVLLKMNGTDLSSFDDIKELLKELAPDDEVAFDILRDGKPETITFNLGDRDS